MRNNRLRKEMQLVNKVSGKLFAVTSVTVAEDGSKVADAVEILPVPGMAITSAEKPEKVKISKANDICFRITYDPGPTEPVTGCEVKEGVIWYNGKPVEQGELVVDKILAPLPGGVLCTVKKEDDGIVDLFFYDVERDIFTEKFTNMKKEYITVLESNDDTAAYIGYVDFDTKKVKKEDGTEEDVTVCRRSVIFKIAYGRMWSNGFYGNVPMFEETKILDQFVIVPYKERVNEDGTLEECDKGYIVFNVEMYEIFRVKSKTTPACLYIPSNHDFLVRTDNKLFVNGYEVLNTDKVGILAEYPYLVDTTAKSKYEAEYTFTDAECTKTVTFTKTTTRDRGVIYKTSLDLE